MLLKSINTLSQVRTRWPIACHGIAHKTLHPGLLHDARGGNMRFSQRKSCHTSLGGSIPTGKSALLGAQNGWHTSKVTQIAFERKGFCTYRRLFQQSQGGPNPYACTQCARSFESASGLADHVHSKHRWSELLKYTPLDDFFRTYEVERGFHYDRKMVPYDSFAALRAHCGWDEEDSNYQHAKEKYGAALRQELNVWFGRENEIAKWNALCRAIGVAPLPQERRECEVALQGTHVNLVYLIHWARTGDEGETVRIFGDVSELREYCVVERKYFLLEEVKFAGGKGDGKVVIRHLLRHLTR